MKYRLIKDRRRRILFSSFEVRAKILRAMIENKVGSATARFNAHSTLIKFPRDSFQTRSRNRCSLTGRSRAVYRQFGRSRLRFRKFALQGILPGVKKASW